MPNWLIKAGVQRAISWLPRTHFWNELLQTHVWKSLGLSEGQFEEVLQRGRRHYDNYAGLRHDLLEGFNVVELGTGWYPIVPVSLYLCGAGDIWCYDVEQFVTAERVQAMLAHFSNYAADGKLRTFLPAMREDRLPALREALADAATAPALETLERLRIHLRTPDAQRTGLPPDTVDFFFSIGTIQHIPRPILANIFAEFRRVSRPRAVMSHFIYLEDQYWNFDKTISKLNYLRYPASQWTWLNSPLTPQNRLRVSDYRKLNRAAGFEVKREDNTSLAASELGQIALAPEFRHYAKEDLLVGWSEMVSQRE